MNIGETKKTGVAEPIVVPIPRRIEKPIPATPKAPSPAPKEPVPAKR